MIDRKNRRYKIIRRGRTTNCGTHTFDEAAKELLDAWDHDEPEVRVKVYDRPGHDRELTNAEFLQLVEAAKNLIVRSP